MAAKEIRFHTDARERMQLAVIAARSGAGGDHLSFHWLFLGGVGDDDAANLLFLLFDALDENAIAQRTNVHREPPKWM